MSTPEPLAPSAVTCAPRTLEHLLSSVAGDDREALVALHHCVAGLVHLNVRRVLRDASWSAAVTEQLFADLPRDALGFDPRLAGALAWLLGQAHGRAVAELRSVQLVEVPPGSNDPGPVSPSLSRLRFRGAVRPRP